MSALLLGSIAALDQRSWSVAVWIDGEESEGGQRVWALPGSASLHEEQELQMSRSEDEATATRSYNLLNVCI